MRRITNEKYSRVATGITFNHPVAFWIGTFAVVAGVLAHFPDFLACSNMGYRMAGMPLSNLMLFGMFLILSGLFLTAYGIVPFGSLYRPGISQSGESLHFQAMDSARLTAQHWGLLFVLGVALIVDTMKPATLGFVVPGTKT